MHHSYHSRIPRAVVAAPTPMVPAIVPGDVKYTMIEEVTEHFAAEDPFFNWYVYNFDPSAYDFSYEEDGPRLWSMADGPMNPDDRMMIVPPLGLASNVNTGRALMAFMVAQEVSHALGPMSTSSTEYDPVCEGGRDHFGASVVLRRVFAGPGYVGLRRRAEQQFIALSEDVEHRMKGYAIFDRCDVVGCHCGYPPGGLLGMYHNGGTARAGQVRMHQGLIFANTHRSQVIGALHSLIRAGSGRCGKGE